MGGSDDPSNLIELTVEEHAEAHKKLFEQHGKWQDEIAWKALSGMIGKEEILHQKYKQINRGKIATEETRKKQAQAKIGKKISEKHKKALNEGRKKSKNSEEHIEIIKNIWKNKNLSEEHKNKIKESRLKRTDLSELSKHAGKIGAEKYKNDTERQKRFSEAMKKWWKERKEKQLKVNS
jgi:hypothetical protein